EGGGRLGIAGRAQPDPARQRRLPEGEARDGGGDRGETQGPRSEGLGIEDPSRRIERNRMKLSELLSEEAVLLDFRAGDKWAAIGSLVEALVGLGRIRPDHRKQVLDALIARENVASTGM